MLVLPEAFLREGTEQAGDRTVAQQRSYLNLLTEHYVRREVEKPFFGKPFVRGLRAVGIYGYLFQAGGLLGSAFRGQRSLFLAVAVSSPDKAGIAATEMAGVAKVVAGYVGRVRTVNEYILTREAEDQGVRPADYLLQFAAAKIPAADVFDKAVMHAYLGAGFGMDYPSPFRLWYDATNNIDREKWQRAHDAGLAIPATPETMSFEEAQGEEVAQFHQFVREAYPQYSRMLGADAVEKT